MENFCLSIEDDKLRDMFYRGIKRRGAFRTFKNYIHRFGLADDWCEFHNIPYSEE